MPDEVPVVLMNLPCHIKGFVCLGSDYNPCIIINSRMTAEQQLKTYKHEMEHIRKGDMYNENYYEYGALT